MHISLERIYFSICEFIAWKSSLHWYAFLEKKKDSFRTILVHKAWLVLRRAIIKIAAGFILRDVELGWNGLFALRHCAPPWNRRYDSPGRRSIPYWRILSAETERESQERRYVKSRRCTVKKRGRRSRPCYRARKFFLARLDTASPLLAAASPRLSRDIVVYFPSRIEQRAFRERVRDLQRSVATDGQRSESDVLTSALWCIAAHRSIVWIEIWGRTGSLGTGRVFSQQCWSVKWSEKKEIKRMRKRYFKDCRELLVNHEGQIRCLQLGENRLAMIQRTTNPQ